MIICFINDTGTVPDFIKVDFAIEYSNVFIIEDNAYEIDKMVTDAQKHSDIDEIVIMSINYNSAYDFFNVFYKDDEDIIIYEYVDSYNYENNKIDHYIDKGSITYISDVKKILNLNNINAIKPAISAISDTKILTVKSDIADGEFDFDSIDEALEYLNNKTVVKNGQFIIRLSDGKHILSKDPVITNISGVYNYPYTFNNLKVAFEAMENTSPVLTIKDYNNYDENTMGVFRFYNSSVAFDGINIDLNPNNTYTNSPTFVRLTRSYLFEKNITINSIGSSSYLHKIDGGCTVYVTSSEYIGGKVSFIFYDYSTFTHYSIMFTDVDGAIFDFSGKVLLKNDQITFTNVSKKYSTYYNGSLITINDPNVYTQLGGGLSDAYIIPSITGQYGTKANRPAMVPGLPSNIPYFDTTVRKPVWWNGDRWKDAIGRNV